jgi:hypothetical protein
MTPTYRWTGRSGTGYYYEIYPIETAMADLPGNYVLCRSVEGGWEPLYFGAAESLAGQCTGAHPAWRAATEQGATHIHAKVTQGGEQKRRDEQADLRGAHETTADNR